MGTVVAHVIQHASPPRGAPQRAHRQTQVQEAYKQACLKYTHICCNTSYALNPVSNVLALASSLDVKSASICCDTSSSGIAASQYASLHTARGLFIALLRHC